MLPVKLVGRVPWTSLEQAPIQRLSYPPYDVVLVREGDDVFALEDACNHAGASLAEGWVKEGCLICPVHQYAFDLGTGALVRPKGLCQPQRTFVARREGDEVAVYDPFKLAILT